MGEEFRYEQVVQGDRKAWRAERAGHEVFRTARGLLATPRCASRVHNSEFKIPNLPFTIYSSAAPSDSAYNIQLGFWQDDN
jgi:hypothetical protein